MNPTHIEKVPAGFDVARRATAMYDGLLSGMNLFASFMVAALMLLITADVCSRAFVGMPFHGVPEITKLSLVTMLWLQTAYTLRQREHLRSTLLLRKLPVAGQRTVLLLNCAAGAGMMGLIAWFGGDELTRAWRINAFEGEHPVRVPVWPIWSIVIAGASLSCFEYMVQAVRAVSLEDIRGEMDRNAVTFE